MTTLEELTIEGCFGLNNLPASIGDLTRMRLCLIEDCQYQEAPRQFLQTCKLTVVGYQTLRDQCVAHGLWRANKD